MSTICYVTLSSVVRDKRSLNQMKLLEEMGHKGILLGLWQEGLLEQETLYSTKIIRLKVKNPIGKIPEFLKYNYKIFKLLKELAFDLLHVHELWPLAGSVLAVKNRKIPIIYDTHEFFSAIEVFKQKKKKKRIWYLVEKLFTPSTNALITVSEPHRRIYNLAYKHFIDKDTMVIYNVPEKISPDKLEAPSKLQLPERYIFFNGHFKASCGIIPMIKSMKYIDDGTVLLMCGYSKMEEEIKALIKEQHLEDRVQVYSNLAHDEILPIAAKALAGIVLFEPSSINNRYAMPDKFFEYIQVETPVIASNLATFRSIFDNYEIGILVSQLTPESVGSAIKQIVSPENQEIFKKNLKIAKEVFNWNMEKQKLAKLYEKLLNR